ncbi:ribosomal-processing cysteine protease Prp [Caldibacillus lycopersici]|uniref:Ribosomal processing cysteine protease Prp n=1 Tax=Perspicuibacillus lycopersici TaxID=1325689 RepID=A0AAE3ITC3_9BACI|nr:ribosomal-processing cysteine protease Prp [Perspicuibacillus lycopersici]MCU9614002.1 ribosomal-processing cysteine protease Prp [Perspicuibacillus lycopersici]
MIYVTIQQTDEKYIQSFSVEGHANFAKHGSDIVCAGVSAVTFGAINAVEALTNVVPAVEQGGKGGYLQCTVPNNLPKETKDKVQLLLQGMLVALQTIEYDYSEYIKITFKK